MKIGNINEKSIKKLKKNNLIKKGITAGIITLTLSFATLGCDQTNKTDNANIVVTMVQDAKEDLEALELDLNESTADNSSIILLLDLIAQKDENGKVSTGAIKKLKNTIDEDKMMDEFNSFLDLLEQYILDNNKVIKISEILPEEMKEDKEILSRLENILESVIEASKNEDAETINAEFDKLYSLFVEEKELEIDGKEFDIRDLDYSTREVANTYAETAGYLSKEYVDSDKLEELDNRTNDQNSKAYIREILARLDNGMDEKSETDVVSLFNTKYDEFNTILDGKVNIDTTSSKNIVNYINMSYLDSEKVSTSDKNTVLGEYDSDDMNDVLTSIDAISKYNGENTKSLIVLSNLLVTDNETDKNALDFVQYNAIMLEHTTNENTTFIQLQQNPYYQNLYKYLTKQNFTHVKNGEETDITWQNISDGVNLINNETIRYTLSKLNINELKQDSGVIDKVELDLQESIQYVQTITTGECQKVEVYEYTK